MNTEITPTHSRNKKNTIRHTRTYTWLPKQYDRPVYPYGFGVFCTQYFEKTLIRLINKKI